MVITSRHFHGYHLIRVRMVLHHSHSFADVGIVWSSFSNKLTIDLFRVRSLSFSMYLIQLSNLFFQHEILWHRTGNKKKKSREKREKLQKKVAACIYHEYIRIISDVKWWKMKSSAFVYNKKKISHTMNFSQCSHARWRFHLKPWGVMGEGFSTPTKPGHVKMKSFRNHRLKRICSIVHEEKMKKKPKKDHFIILVRKLSCYDTTRKKDFFLFE